MLTISLGDRVQVRDEYGQGAIYEGTIDRISVTLDVTRDDGYQVESLVLDNDRPRDVIVDVRRDNGTTKWAYGYQIIKARKQRSEQSSRREMADPTADPNSRRLNR